MTPLYWPVEEPARNRWCFIYPGTSASERRLWPEPEPPFVVADLSHGGRPERAPAGSPRLEVHVTAAGSGRSLLLLRLLHDDGLGREEQTSDGGRILNRRARHLRRVDDPGLEHVDVIARRSVQAVTCVQTTHLLDHHAALEAGVDGDLLERLLERTAHDARACGLVARQLELLEGVLAGLEQGDAATGDHTLLDGGLGVPHSVLDAVLALLQLDLG